MKLKRFATLFLALVFVFLLTLPTCAKKDTAIRFTDDDSFTYDGKQYERYYSFDHLDRYFPEASYCMDAEIVDQDGATYSRLIYTNAEKDMFLFPEEEETIGSGRIPAIYLLSSVYHGYLGDKSMREYENWDSDSSYVVSSEDGGFAPYPYHEIKVGSSGNLAIDIFAEGLKNYACYEINAFYDDGEFARCLGAIYENNGRYLYVDYGSIPKYCFGSDGKLDYDGNFKVRAYRVYSASVPLLEESLSSMELREIKFEDATPSFVEVYAAEILFWSFFTLVGFLIPLVPLILGLVFAASKKTEAFKRWVLLTLLSLVWIVVSALILIVIFL